MEGSDVTNTQSILRPGCTNWVEGLCEWKERTTAWIGVAKSVTLSWPPLRYEAIFGKWNIPIPLLSYLGILLFVSFCWCKLVLVVFRSFHWLSRNWLTRRSAFSQFRRQRKKFSHRHRISKIHMSSLMWNSWIAPLLFPELPVRWRTVASRWTASRYASMVWLPKLSSAVPRDTQRPGLLASKLAGKLWCWTGLFPAQPWWLGWSSCLQSDFWDYCKLSPKDRATWNLPQLKSWYDWPMKCISRKLLESEKKCWNLIHSISVWSRW